MEDKLKRYRAGKKLTAEDCWPVMIEFLLSQKAWWVAVCAEFDLTPMQGHAVRVLDPERPLAMSTLAAALGRRRVANPLPGAPRRDGVESRGPLAGPHRHRPQRRRSAAGPRAR